MMHIKVFSSHALTFEDDRFPYYEQRFNTIGMLNNAVVVIAFTERDETVRIISKRKASKNEKKIYFTGFTN